MWSLRYWFTCNCNHKKRLLFLSQISIELGMCCNVKILVRISHVTTFINGFSRSQYLHIFHNQLSAKRALTPNLTWLFLHAGLHCQPQWDKSLQEGPKVTYRKFGVQHNIHSLHPGEIWWYFEQANRRIEAILFKLCFWLGSNRMNEIIRVHAQHSNFEVKLCIGNEEFEECESQIWIISLLSKLTF